MLRLINNCSVEQLTKLSEEGYVELKAALEREKKQ